MSSNSFGSNSNSNSNSFGSSASANPFSTSASANPFNSSTSASANPFNANSYSGLSPEFRSCIRASPGSSSPSSGIPGDWHGPIDSPTGYKSNNEIPSYKLTDCQKLIQEIVADIRNILVDYENLPEGFQIQTNAC